MSITIGLGNDLPPTNSLQPPSPMFASICGQNATGNPVFIKQDGSQYSVPSSGDVQAQLTQTKSTSNQIPLDTKLTSFSLGGLGSYTPVTIPYLDSARVYFSTGKPIQFYANTATPQNLVQPSLTNTSDTNYNTPFGWAELAFSDKELYANITYVDAVGIPIALHLEDTTGNWQHVSGIPAAGIQTIVQGLIDQTTADKPATGTQNGTYAPWDQLVQYATDDTSRKNPLRIISPNQLIASNFGAAYFGGYFDGPNSIVPKVWNQYSSMNMIVTTDNSNTYAGIVQNGVLNFTPYDSKKPGPGVPTVPPTGGPIGTVVSPPDSSNIVAAIDSPSTAAIFSNSSGAFAYIQNDEHGAINARVGAGFNRGTLLSSIDQPDGSGGPSSYYPLKNPDGSTCQINHYARIVHAANLDGKGYCFPYDDVGSVDVSGKVSSTIPKLLNITAGGFSAHA